MNNKDVRFVLAVTAFVVLCGVSYLATETDAGVPLPLLVGVILAFGLFFLWSLGGDVKSGVTGVHPFRFHRAERPTQFWIILGGKFTAAVSIVGFCLYALIWLI